MPNKFKETTLRHIIINLSNAKDMERTLQKRKAKSYMQRKPHKTADFSAETLKTK